MEADFLFLGVSPFATKEEIRRAYKKKCLLYHPDKRSGGKGQTSAEEFIHLTEAYQRVMKSKDTSTTDSAEDGDQPDYEMYSYLIDILIHFLRHQFVAPPHPNTKSSTALLPGDVIVPCIVTPQEVFQKDVKKMVIKVQLNDQGLMGKEECYIALDTFQSVYTFKGKGDAVGGRRGDLHVRLNVQCPEPFSWDPQTPFDACMDHEVTLTEAIWGFSHTFEYLDGSEVVLVHPPLLLTPWVTSLQIERSPAALGFKWGVPIVGKGLGPGGNLMCRLGLKVPLECIENAMKDPFLQNTLKSWAGEGGQDGGSA